MIEQWNNEQSTDNISDNISNLSFEGSWECGKNMNPRLGQYRRFTILAQIRWDASHVISKIS